MRASMEPGYLAKVRRIIAKPLVIAQHDGLLVESLKKLNPSTLQFSKHPDVLRLFRAAIETCNLKIECKIISYYTQEFDP